MNMRNAFFSSAFILAASIGASAQTYDKLPNGLEYRYEKRGTSTYEAKPGDIATLNLVYKIADSTLIDSKKMNNNQPFEQPLNLPASKGDVFEGILKMKKGDVCDFRLPAKVFFEENKQPLPEWVKPEDFVTWHVEMVDLKDQVEVKKEMEAKAAAQIATDDKLILDDLKAKGIKVKALPKTGVVKADPKVAYKDSTGLYYIVTKVGTGAKCNSGSKVSVNYTGSLLDGTIFDSNVDAKFNHVEPIEITAGTGQVIKGWDRILTRMKVGQKVTTYLPSGLAYGPQARPPHIPANGVLKFDMELLKVQ